MNSIAFGESLRKGIFFLQHNQWIFALILTIFTTYFVLKIISSRKQKKKENYITNRFNERVRREHIHFSYFSNIVFIILTGAIWVLIASV